jgi:hypothetical protein
MGEDPNNPSAPVSGLIDYVVKNVTGVSVLSGASYVQNIGDVNYSGVAVTNSSAGTAYFGPMIFLE